MYKYFYVIYIIFSFLLLIYLLWPYEVNNIEDFTTLPNSCRSTLDGDTVQVPNLKAYFSDIYRSEAINKYKKEMQGGHKLFFPPLKFNLPPEDAFTFIKVQTQSTYLEQYTYPLRGTIYINGLEPFDEESKKPRYSAATPFVCNDTEYETKVTIRYYQTSLVSRIFSYLMINLAIFLAYKIVQKYH